MPTPVKFQEMLDDLRKSLGVVPEHRRGRNIQYEIEDAGLGAFSVFCLQSPSFLAYQQQMRERQGQDNARSLFGVEDIPSDGQIRNLLDPVEPGLLREPFWDIYDLAWPKIPIRSRFAPSKYALEYVPGYRCPRDACGWPPSACPRMVTSRSARSSYGFTASCLPGE